MSETNMNSKNSKQNLELEAKIEALLFVSPSATAPKQIADALGESVGVINRAIKRLGDQLSTRGLRLQENKGRYQLTTAPELSEAVENFLHLEATSKLSPASLEALAIVAYQQPATRPMIDSIRGVNSDSVIRNLLSKGLIEESGRSDGPGRPILYSTAPEFLQYFGLTSLKDLPPIDLAARHKKIKESLSPEQAALPLDNHLLKE
ncbi:MAG: SMC-Scp complex subunit ScpB [Chloroflexota bacterium]